MKKKELKAKYQHLIAENVLQKGTIESQRRVIESLMIGVEDHTGKDGTTPVLTYIARIEDELEFWKRMMTLMGWDLEQLLEVRQMGRDSADKLFKAFENYDG